MQSSGVGFVDRFTGCLLGMAIGDALGVAGTPPDSGTTAPDYRARLAGDGSIEVPAGQFSLNTDLAFCLLETLVTSDGFVDPELTVHRFENAMRQPDLYLADEREARAVAHAVDSEEYQSGGDGPSTGYAGPAVRAVSIGMVHSLSDMNIALITREVIRSVLLTDGNPLVVNAALAVAHAVRLILREDAPLEIVIDEVLSLVDEDDVARALRRGMPDGPPDDAASVVAAALHATAQGRGDFEAAAQTVCDLGGATHLTGAIAGALCGAYRGASALRPDLVEGLEGRAYVLMAAPALLRTAQMRAGVLFQLRIR